MRGKPKFKYGDKVKFKMDGENTIGEVYIIDAYGTFADDSDVSYDIFVSEGKYANFLIKHVREGFVTKA